MECGEQCVVMVTGIPMMPELCADNWGTMSIQVEVRWFIQIGDVIVQWEIFTSTDFHKFHTRGQDFYHIPYRIPQALTKIDSRKKQLMDS